MLFLLTGDVQIGKTRWLERLAAELAGDGVPVAGVLAPCVCVSCGFVSLALSSLPST